MRCSAGGAVVCCVILRQAGDTIAMWLPECSEKHVAQLAAARIGMVVAEVDPQLASGEAVGKILEQSGATVSTEKKHCSDPVRGRTSAKRVSSLPLIFHVCALVPCCSVHRSRR